MGNIQLYEHNRIAYEKVKTYIAEYGKACVIHPTGAGKSYIGFALVEDNPGRRFLWISPNKYIYETQIDNLTNKEKKILSNVVFHTYAWLSRNRENLDSLNPEYIIIDEFHRAGAVRWGEGLNNLISLYPNAKILGLTATNIRYLDKQRDMAKELFDGKIASDMSLTDAIARRILPSPHYVISVYSYKEKMRYYEKRVQALRNGKKKEESKILIEKLKTRLEQALGLEQIFAKHIKNKMGKYIVFCSSINHMFDMMAQVPLWFCYVDRRPHIYYVYSSNYETKKDFKDFMNDNSSHLKLIFVIDMLNEGVHITGVDGVILLRPTVSPIVYKQQIGRALAAGKKGTPIIFDLVNNFDSLYNISALKEELETVFSMYDLSSSDKEQYNRFEVIDELQDCRSLFEILQKNLNSTWNEYYQALCRYKDTHGNVIVPRRYIDDNDLYLGRWLGRQKNLYNNDKLTSEQVAKFELLGVEWEYERDKRFEKWYSLLCEYKREYGNVDVPSGYVSPDGKKLGNWCNNIRTMHRAGKVCDERVERLNRLGFDWIPFGVYWKEGYIHARQYYEEYGNLDVGKQYKCSDGYRLGYWIRTQRLVRDGKLGGIMNRDRINALDEIGMIWKVKSNDRFDEFLDAYVLYIETKGTKDIFCNYIDESGLRVGQWVFRMRKQFHDGTLSEYKKKRLDEIVFDFQESLGSWMVQYKKAKAYYEESGSFSITNEYTAINGCGLSEWVSTQRREYRKPNHGNLTDRKLQLLKDINFPFQSKYELSWIRGYDALSDYVKRYGDTLVSSEYYTDDGFHLGKWVNRIKGKYRNGRLDSEQIGMLNELGMCWDNLETKKAEIHWNTMYEEAKKYYTEHGNLNVPNRYVTEDGHKLYTWLMQQRRIRRGEIKHSIVYTEERIDMMDQIGMDWGRPKLTKTVI